MDRPAAVVAVEDEPPELPFQGGALRPVHIEKFRTAMRERARVSGRPLSDGTQLNIHRVLSEALNEAVRVQLLATNPARAVRLGKPRRAKREVLTDNAASRLLAAARGTGMEVPVALAVGAGLRRSEILGLRWGDVNLTAAEVRVERSLQATRGGALAFGEPKSDTSRRTVSIPAFVVAALRRHHSEQAKRRLLLGEAWVDEDLVVDDGTGAPWHPDRLTAAFRRLARQVGVPATLHGLRRTYGSLSLKAGVPLKVVSEQLGHASIAITADIYTDVYPELRADAARKINDLLEGGLSS